MHDQINSRARTILWVLFAASGLLFVIACSNVANLILARTVRREPELAIRSALGSSTADFRRSLLAESLVLCGSGALAGLAIAAPMVNVLARYASRFSVRALDLTLDFSLVWIGVSLAIAAAVFLAFPGFVTRVRTRQQRCPGERRQQAAAGDFCRDANHRILPVVGRGGGADEDPVGHGKYAATV
jgi:cell division protein FtsX